MYATRPMNGAASSEFTAMYATTTRSPGSRRVYASPSRTDAKTDCARRSTGGGMRSWVTAKITAKKLSVLMPKAHE